MKRLKTSNSNHFNIFRFVIFTIISCFIIGCLFFLKTIKPTQFQQFKNTDKSLCKNCNVLVIDIDILRADELPCYGYRRNTAPNLCALAEKSIIFSDNYSASIWTLPSIFSTITSLNPTFHKMVVPYASQLSPSIPTLAEVLTNNGYNSVFNSYDLNKSVFPSPLNGGLRGYAENSVTQVGETIAKTSQNPKPWFIHYYNSDLHSPYLLPSEDTPTLENLPAPKNLPITAQQYQIKYNSFLKKHAKEIFKPIAFEKYGSIITAPEIPNDTTLADILESILLDGLEREYLYSVAQSQTQVYQESFDPNSKADFAYLRLLYDTNISLLDKRLGDLFKFLELPQFKNNTIVIITSDHGEGFGEHGKLFHSENYHTEQFFTPLIVYVPGITPRKVDQSSSNLDIFPTILELLEIAPIKSLEGQSLVPYMLGKPKNPNTFIKSETYSGKILQNKTWLYFLDGSYEDISSSILINKLNDPEEKINVAKKYPDLTLSLYNQADLLFSYDNYLNGRKKPIFDRTTIDPRKIQGFKVDGYF